MNENTKNLTYAVKRFRAMQFHEWIESFPYETRRRILRAWSERSIALSEDTVDIIGRSLAIDCQLVVEIAKLDGLEVGQGPARRRSTSARKKLLSRETYEKGEVLRLPDGIFVVAYAGTRPNELGEFFYRLARVGT
jgi:hypothetical protein